MTEHSTEHADPAWPHPSSAAARAGEQWAPDVCPAEQQFTPGEPIPDPFAPSGPTRWVAPTQDYALPADSGSMWSAPDPPGEVPPPVAGVNGPHTRPGWLTRGRYGDRDGAA